MWDQLMMDELRRRQAKVIPDDLTALARQQASPPTGVQGYDPYSGKPVAVPREAVLPRVSDEVNVGGYNPPSRLTGPLNLDFTGPVLDSPERADVATKEAARFTPAPTITNVVQTQAPPANRGKYDPPTAAETTDLWNYMNQRDRQLQWDQAAPRRAMMEFQSQLDFENQRRMRDYILKTGQADTVEGQHQKRLELVDAEAKAKAGLMRPAMEKDAERFNAAIITDPSSSDDSVAQAAKAMAAANIKQDIIDGYLKARRDRKLSTYIAPDGRRMDAGTPEQALEAVMRNVNAGTDVEKFLGEAMPILQQGNVSADLLQKLITQKLASRPNIGDKWVGPTGVEHSRGGRAWLDAMTTQVPPNVIAGTPEEYQRYFSANPREALPMDEYKRLQLASAAYEQALRRQRGY